MAPGAYGDYRSHDSLCSEFSVDILRKKEYCQDTHRDCGDLQKDGMHREYIKGEHIRISGIFNRNGSNGKVPVMGLASKSFTDREPGEVSSEDNSGIKDQIKGSDEKDAASSDRKRKFLPIEGVRIDKICNAVRPKFLNKELSISLQSDHSLPQKCFNPFSAKRIRKPEDLSTSTDHNASIYYMHGVPLDNDDFDEQMDEDYVPESALYLSRWADANDFLEDTKDISDMNIFPNKMKNNFLSPTQGINSDFGEVLLREGSQGSSSVSGELSKESCLESMEDGICEEISNGAESDSSLEGCSVRSLDFMEPPCSSISMRQGCRTVDEFEKLNKINEGTYGIVYRARDKKTGEIVALKKVKMEKEREGFPLTSLREINILLSLHHPSIVEVKEVVLGRDLDSVFTVMEYMEHDLKGLMETMKKPFHISEVKCLMLQLLAGVKHLHDNWVLHRDLKTSNLLFNNHGELKICDFGLSRQYSSPLKPYTKLVVTMWYRAPELLLGAKEYSTAIDMWSVGCILAELLTKQPIFPGKNELDQLDKIFKVLGSPDVKIWPGFTSLPGATVNFAKKPFKLREKFPRMSATSFVGHSFLSDVGFDLLTKLLTHDPEKRITADDALNHPWFRESPLPTTKDFMPAFPARHRQDSHQQRILKSSDLLEQLTQKDSQ